MCWAAFRVFDQNGDGQITLEELKQVLNSGEVEGIVGGQGIEKLMTEIDSDGDGVIDFQEFMKMMRGAQG